MNITLTPKPPAPPESAAPDSILLYGAPKCGKSRVLADLPCYVFQFDPGGSRHHGGMWDEYLTYEALDKALDEADKVRSTLPRFIAVDPLDRLEDLAALKALAAYQKRFPKEIGVRTVADLLGLPFGLGYGFLREEFNSYLRRFALLGRTVVFMAHVRPKAMDKELGETSAADLALTGKCCRIICGAVDVIGFLRRTAKGELVMSTRTSSDGKQDVNCGSRIKRLANKDILLSQSDRTGNITTHWDEIFPSLKAGTEPAK